MAIVWQVFCLKQESHGGAKYNIVVDVFQIFIVHIELKEVYERQKTVFGSMQKPNNIFFMKWSRKSSLVHKILPPLQAIAVGCYYLVI